MEGLNKRFTAIADRISEALGQWWFSVLSLILLLFWIFYGISIIGGGNWFTSNQWNFPLNTVTTVGEWFLAALVAAATNRVERRHDALLEQIKANAATDLHTTEHDAETNQQAEQKIDQLSRDVQTIKRLLAKVVTE